jgi:NADH-quinone oxidoreductase subunit K
VIPAEYYLVVAAVVFVIGSAGFFFRRNVLVQLMCIELLLNSVNLTLVTFNRVHQDDESGQMFAFFVIAVAAAEAALGLAIALSMYRLSRSVRSDEADLLRN